ncbi:MAG: hypothetical protein GX312_04365 [Candidatus Phytoplasma sp.]|nr:hypothetical protein [Phytoplasma sp.]
MIAIPALVSGGLALFGSTGALAHLIGITGRRTRSAVRWTWWLKKNYREVNMLKIIEHEKKQLANFKESLIYKDFKEAAVKFGYEDKVLIDDMHPDFLKHQKLQNARILYVGFYKKGHVFEDVEGLTYDATTSLSYISKKGHVKLFDWREDSEFIMDINELISKLKKQSKNIE